jgi:HEAT repeat protein
MNKQSFLSVFLLVSLAVAAPLVANGAQKTEDQYIEQLADPKAGKVVDALVGLEKNYPTSTKAIPDMKKLLTDPRPDVRRKAARVLGILHADVSKADINHICALLKSSDDDEVVDGLKALRGLKAASAVPEILPLLKHTDEHVVRDSCRTLAVIGDKDVISSIEPLLNNKNSAIQKDAQDAIFALRAK